jgi:hypothetical protein
VAGTASRITIERRREREVDSRVLAPGARPLVTGVVDLDDQPRVRPAEVDLEAVELEVDERLAKAGGYEECEESGFVAALEAGATGQVVVDRPV